MGRTGVCFDNAMIQSFWSTLKTEFYDRSTWVTRDQACKAVAYWIEVVYNRRRRHSAIGMIPPVTFENQTTQKRPQLPRPILKPLNYVSTICGQPHFQYRPN
ncbi:hypothetical protein CENDO_05295 [Corynebacterium endometrii]|uniref:Integrase catalytic domain-containing protein n=1 Tax=Corynebacterium endometrii TaxID=2488819 RepID=A0A4P7QHN4_9CORY|nr:hypothetical protein CENDO_05295 [Corynebacterium endometrii]